MHRAILQACLPWFLWLCVASALVLLLVQLCGGGCDWRRLRRLSRCEAGAVQSLSLVLTLPVFLMLVLFIVQITQIMVGIMMVNYAAFAAARSASVWIPADVTTDATFNDPPFNNTSIDVPAGSIIPITELIVPTNNSGQTPTNGPLEPANVIAGTMTSQAANKLQNNDYGKMDATSAVASFKYQKIWMAAVVPCLTISPSRAIAGNSLPSPVRNTYNALIKLFPQVDPKVLTNKQMPARLLNKLSYSARYTTVDVTWKNVPHPLADNVQGPTYNPYLHPVSSVPQWNPTEVGFRDPVTVVVQHQFALLPGIGRILGHATDPKDASKEALDPADDPVANRIAERSAGSDYFYTVQLEASATFINEGYKSVVRYAVQP